MLLRSTIKNNNMSDESDEESESDEDDEYKYKSNSKVTHLNIVQNWFKQ